MIELAPETLLNQALQHLQRGELTEAEKICRQVVDAHPSHAQAPHMLGFVLGQGGDKENAVTWIQRAITLAPNDPTMYANLGIWLCELGHFDEAIAAQRHAVRLIPASDVAHYNLATALEAGGRMNAAIASYELALRLAPRNGAVCNNLAHCLVDRGEIDRALELLRASLRIDPNQPVIQSSLNFLLQFQPGHTATMLCDELAAWNRQHAAGFARPALSHRNARDPARLLRVGWVSANFRDHVVGRNILPLFEWHDRRHFQYFCFSDVTASDALTAKFRGSADGLYNIAGQKDQAVADLVESNGIDILVDLTLHMANNRLLVFARKPAPVQVTFAGYPGSTGLAAIDNRLTDPYLDPLGQDDSIYSETSVRLPHSFWCYAPPEEPLAVSALPAMESGHVTFGCLNHFRKINQPLLELWARTMLTVPSSRLLMMAPVECRARILETMKAQGIEPHRLSFVAALPRHTYLQQYHQIDIGLDTHPYNGHTTSLDSFYMGVPVISKVGSTVVGRAGVSQSMNLGLPELIAHTDDQFVEIAASMARDLPRLKALRMNLRPRMQASPLMDAARFSRDVESAFRAMWRTWCASGSGSEESP